ncbi:uncharacterized protein [Pempheris klunzingeri]|uniref:uncharacterized protein n=1 Tax=Pempheris klunzingeri TaxID=3127111 RepID=UPI0039811344
MAKYISELDVSLDAAEEQLLQSQGFLKINTDLNKGAGGNYIYLWYKTGTVPITKLQVTFNDGMAVGLIDARYTKIPKNLNAGTKGDGIYLWYFRGSGEYDTPIVDIDVTADPKSEAHKFALGYEKLACDLNRKAQGNWIHIWVKREKQTYISDVTVTDSYELDSGNFKAGFIRVDEDTNRDAGGKFVFIWYRQTTNSQNALTDVNVSTNDAEYQSLQQQQYKQVSVDLNEGTGGNREYLWFKTDQVKKPIKAITLLLSSVIVPDYQKAGVTVIKRNLNTGNNGCVEFLCVYQ